MVVAGLVLLVGLGGAGLVAALVGGDAVVESLRFYATDSIRLTWQIAIPLIVVLVWRRWADDLGLSRRRVAQGLRAAFIWGPILFAVVLLINYAWGTFRNYELTLADVVMNSAYFAIANAFAEELFFRGLLQTLIIRFVVRNQIVGVLITALIFGLYHIPQFGWSLESAMISAAGGVIFGFAFVRRRSIVTPWVLHGLADLAILNNTIGTYLLDAWFGGGGPAVLLL